MFGRMKAPLLKGLVVAGRALPVMLRDAVGVAAVGSIAYGSWLLNPAAGFIVGGMLVLAGVLLSSRQNAG